MNQNQHEMIKIRDQYKKEIRLIDAVFADGIKEISRTYILLDLLFGVLGVIAIIYITDIPKEVLLSNFIIMVLIFLIIVLVAQRVVWNFTANGIYKSDKIIDKETRYALTNELSQETLDKVIVIYNNLDCFCDLSGLKTRLSSEIKGIEIILNRQNQLDAHRKGEIL